MAQLMKCKCGNYLSDCSCVITKMDLRTPPTMKEQETCLKCGEYLRPECLEDGDTICVDCVYEIPDYEKQDINLATMKEPMERPKREEFIIEYKNQPISPTMYVRTDWQQYSKALEAYIDHLTAEQGDCPHSPFDWEGRCTICGEQLFTAPQPQELTVREVQESLTMTEVFSMTQNQWTIATQTEVRQIGKSSDELTKIIRHQP